MSVATIFPSTASFRRRIRRAVWQLSYRTTQILPNVVLLLFLYSLFLAVFLISASTVAVERIAEWAAAAKVLSAKSRSGNNSRRDEPARGLYT